MTERDPRILEEALNIIAHGGCERYTNDSKCRDEANRFRVAVYTAQIWCDPCIALEALERYDPAQYT